MSEWGVPSNLITVIRSSIDLENRAQPAKVTELKKRFRGRKVIGCVGSLEGRKDHSSLLEAAVLLKKKRNDVIFVLIGDGVLRPDLETKTKELGLGNVIFEGHQDDPYSYYPVFDVFLMTSRSEGLGSAILDAFLYRIPVVATAAGGIPELVVDGKTGLLASVGRPDEISEHLLRMLEDPDLRHHCTSEAYILVTRDFAVPAMAKAYYQIYVELTRASRQKNIE
jgi:glycosyltransferase involved in cell wall biosynthesis